MNPIHNISHLNHLRLNIWTSLHSLRGTLERMLKEARLIDPGYIRHVWLKINRDNQDEVAQIVIDLSKQIPYNHPSQIRLAYIADTIVAYYGPAKTYDKTALREQIRSLADSEALYILLSEKDMETDNRAKLKAWVNFNAFYAISYPSIVGYNPFIPCAILGRTFEANSRDHFGFEIHQYCVMGAAQWIFWSGQYLYERTACLFCRCDDSILKERATIFDICQCRWTTWKEGFRAASQNENYSIECKGLAIKAVERMDRIEQDVYSYLK